MEFRIATAADAAEISGIYSRYIGTPVTFEYTLPDAGEFALRIQKTLERYPYLVAVEAGKIRGYASAHRFQARAAYQWGAELSIYLEPAATSRGIGGRLYALLIALLAKQGIRTVYGCVTIPNPASERLHERLGFQLAGRFRRAGFKNGGWHDIAYYEKAIAPGDNHPPPPIPFPEIPSGEVRRLLAAYSDGSRP